MLVVTYCLGKKKYRMQLYLLLIYKVSWFFFFRSGKLEPDEQFNTRITSLMWPVSEDGVLLSLFSLHGRFTHTRLFNFGCTSGIQRRAHLLDFGKICRHIRRLRAFASLLCWAPLSAGSWVPAQHPPPPALVHVHLRAWALSRVQLQRERPSRQLGSELLALVHVVEITAGLPPSVLTWATFPVYKQLYEELVLRLKVSMSLLRWKASSFLLANSFLDISGYVAQVRIFSIGEVRSPAAGRGWNWDPPFKVLTLRHWWSIR